MRHSLFSRACLAATIWSLLAAREGCADPPPVKLHEHVHGRRPVAAAWLDPGRVCVVANQRSGTLTRVDVMQRRVLDEQSVALRAADLVACPDTGRLLVVDDKSHELLVVHYDDAGRLIFDGRTAVSPYPGKIAVAPAGYEAAVSCRWSRSIDVAVLRPRESESPAEVWNAAFPRVVARIALPFVPRDPAFLPDGERLLVAEAFGGRIAAIDWRRRELLAVHSLDAHNLHGFVIDAERRTTTLVGQRLDPQLPTTAAHLQSGALLKNRLWRIPYDRLCRPDPLAAGDVEIVELDQGGHGAGDPSATISVADGELLVALGGVAQAALVDDEGAIRSRFEVGLHPVALLASPIAPTVVVNRLDDSLSVVDLPSRRVEHVALGPAPEPYPRDRGERMFFDARLSLGNTLSCHSCHTDGHSNGLTSDTLGDGGYGNPKRVISLLGTALTDHWSWNGQLRELRDQVRQSLETTMHHPPIGPDRHDDLVAFLHTLPFAPPPEPQPRDEADRRLLERGRTLFKEWNCAACHIGPLTYTSQGTYDVGLRDERGLAKFNPPSLRGVGQGTGFFHDNRAATLDDVLRVYRHQVPDDAEDADLDAVLRFLRSL